MSIQSEISLAVLWTLLAAGCVADRAAERTDGVVRLPDSYEVEAGAKEPAPWYGDFGSEELDELIVRALSDNLRIAAAWERLRRADALVEQSGSALWPTVTASLRAGRSRRESFLSAAGDDASGSVPGRGGVPETGDATFTETRIRGALAARYEVDVWGELRAQASAVELDRDAAGYAAQSLALSIAARVTDVWLDLIWRRELDALLEEQAGVSSTILELIRTRAAVGNPSTIDAKQQAQQVEGLRAEQIRNRLRLNLDRNLLAVLLGVASDEGIEVETARLPEPPALPDPGVPADLLRRRPDVRAAWLRLRAADERSAAAAAARLPGLNLSARVFDESEEVESLFEQTLWSLGAEAVRPLFTAGRLEAEQEEREAGARERLYDYSQTLLTALREVRDAFDRIDRLRELDRSLGRQLEKSGEALELARTQYRNGTASYIQVLTLLRSRQELEQRRLELERRRLGARLRLLRALGGGWTADVSPEGEGT